MRLIKVGRDRYGVGLGAGTDGSELGGADVRAYVGPGSPGPWVGELGPHIAAALAGHQRVDHPPALLVVLSVRTRRVLVARPATQPHSVPRLLSPAGSALRYGVQPVWRRGARDAGRQHRWLAKDRAADT